MRAAGFLLALSFVVALIASDVERTSPAWVVLVWAIVALFVAAVLRVHAVVNGPRAGE